MLLCFEIDSFFKQNLQKSYLVVGIFAFVFPEGAFLVYICIRVQMGYAGVGQGKPER